MIGEKKIKAAAILNAEKYNPCRSTLDREEACRASFEDGIKWLKQAIWHERNEEPTEEGVIIKRLAKKGEIYLTFFNWVKVKDDIIESQKGVWKHSRSDSPMRAYRLETMRKLRQVVLPRRPATERR